LGLPLQEPFPELFKNQKGMNTSAKYPSMQDLTQDWDSISESIKTTFSSISEDSLESKFPQSEITGSSLGDFVAFLIHHEAYTLGQLDLYRRFHGMEPMKYN
jgi:hypothetical protein